MNMTPENFEERLRVFKDVAAANSERAMAWYVLNDKNEVKPTDYHGWLTWTKTGDPVIIWDCTVQGVRIVTAFFGHDERFFETARVSAEGRGTEVCTYLTWADALAGHQKKVDEQQAL